MYKRVCHDLIQSGWTLNDVEEMDIHFYFELLGYKEEKTYIDEIKL